LNTLEVVSDKSVNKINTIPSCKIALNIKLVVTSKIAKLYGSRSSKKSKYNNLAAEIGIG